MNNDTFTKEYERLDDWRTRWYRLIQRPYATLQNRQDRIVRRIRIANNNIHVLMQQYDRSIDEMRGDVIPEIEYYHPKDDNKQRWLLVFEDVDVGTSIFYNEDEAIVAFNAANVSWNCHLFQSMVRKTQ